MHMLQSDSEPSVRNQIVENVNLVSETRQNEKEQKRWLKKAVRSYKWARQTTTRAHKLSFSKMHSTLKAQAIEEDKAEKAGGIYRATGSHSGTR